MAKKRNKKQVKQDANTSGLSISIPVYLSDLLPVDKADESLFPYTQENMIERAKEKIEEFNNSPFNHTIENDRSNSPIKHGIKHIEVSDLSFNTDKCLLLKVSAYQTNFCDGYYFNSTDHCEHHFNAQDKLCIDTYHIILYPRIYKNILKGKHAAYWHVFLYLDPLKELKVMSKLARHIMSKVVGSPIRNVKSEKFLSDIRKTSEFAKVIISLNTLSDGDDTEPDYVTNYKFESKIKKSKVLTLYNVKPEDAIKALDDTCEVGNHARRTLRFETNEQRVFSAIQEWKDKLCLSFEDSFNYTIEITNSEMISKKIFEIDFIKAKLEGLFTRYLIPYEYDD